MRTEVVVFGREPRPGRVKTRLAAAVGARAAAAIYRALLERALAQALATGWPVTLALAERPGPAVAWRPPAGVAVEAQEGADLGARMARAFAGRFAAGAETVVLVGSDAPTLGAGAMRAAARACARRPVAIAPSADGGYALVAQRAPGIDLFTGVPWSSPRTLAATRRRLRELGAGWTELPATRDLDTAADLAAALSDPALDPRLRARLERALAGPGSGRRA